MNRQSSTTHHHYPSAAAAAAATTPAAGTAHRYSNAHGSSSAFSASANPNEDWTKVSDLAERRRIQNRIAQRNYRKKLKKRLEDLERRANSNSASPEPEASSTQHHQQQQQQSSVESHQSSASTTTSATDSTYPAAQEDQFYTSRHQPSASPPAFTYSQYPTDGINFPSHPQSPAFHSYPMPSPELPAYGTNYLSTSANQPIHLGEHVKHEAPYDEGFGGYNAYGWTAGSAFSHAYRDSAPHTPPSTSDMFDTFDDSTVTSPELFGHWYHHPPTPELIEDSPPMGFFA